jgi:hypothetical protein
MVIFLVDVLNAQIKSLAKATIHGAPKVGVKDLDIDRRTDLIFETDARCRVAGANWPIVNVRLRLVAHKCFCVLRHYIQGRFWRGKVTDKHAGRQTYLIHLLAVPLETKQQVAFQK